MKRGSERHGENRSADSSSMLKRLFDVLVSSVGLLLISPLMLVAAVVVRTTSAGPVFFRQNTLAAAAGRFHPKFRTMVQNAAQLGGPITFGSDPRVTPVGRLLRKTKLDELPQLINVLNGDMSLVGPRPEVRKYVEMFRQDYEEILRVRPGITDLASIKYRDEETVLGNAADPEQNTSASSCRRKSDWPRSMSRASRSGSI